MELRARSARSGLQYGHRFGTRRQAKPTFISSTPSVCCSEITSRVPRTPVQGGLLGASSIVTGLCPDTAEFFPCLSRITMDRILLGSHIILGTTSTAKLLHTPNPWLYKTRTILGEGLALCGHEVPSAKVNKCLGIPKDPETSYRWC